MDLGLSEQNLHPGDTNWLPVAATGRGAGLDDLQYGTRDERGNRAPSKPLHIAPFWEGRWGEMGHFVIK